MICFKCQDNVVCSPSLTGVCKEICCAKDRCNSTVGKREPIETTDPRKWHLKCADQSADEATNQTSTNSDTNQSSWVWVKIGYPNNWMVHTKNRLSHLWYPGFFVLTHTHWEHPMKHVNLTSDENTHLTSPLPDAVAQPGNLV